MQWGDIINDPNRPIVEGVHAARVMPQIWPAVQLRLEKAPMTMTSHFIKYACFLRCSTYPNRLGRVKHLAAMRDSTAVILTSSVFSNDAAPTTFLGSSVVEQVTVNHLVGGSNPSRGANERAIQIIWMARFFWASVTRRRPATRSP